MQGDRSVEHGGGYEHGEAVAGPGAQDASDETEHDALTHELVGDGSGGGAQGLAQADLVAALGDDGDHRGGHADHGQCEHDDGDDDEQGAQHREHARVGLGEAAHGLGVNVGVRGVHRVGDGAELIAFQGDRILGERHGAGLPGQRAHVLSGHVHVAVFVAAGLEDAGHGQGDGTRIDLEGRGLRPRLGGGLRGRARIQLADRNRVTRLDVDRRGDLLTHEHLTRRGGPLTIHVPVRVHGMHGVQVRAARDVRLVVDGDGLVVEGRGSDQSARGHLGGRGGHGLVRDGHVTGGGDDEVGAVGANLSGQLGRHVDGDRDEAGQRGRADGDGEDRDEDAGATAQDGGGDHPPEHCSSGHVHHLPCRTSAALRRSK